MDSAKTKLLCSSILPFLLCSCGITVASEVSFLSGPQSIEVVEFVYMKASPTATLEGNTTQYGNYHFPYTGETPSLDFANDVTFVDDSDPYVSHVNLSATFFDGIIKYADRNGVWNKTYEPKMYDHLILVAFDSYVAESLPMQLKFHKAFYETPVNNAVINSLE